MKTQKIAHKTLLLVFTLLLAGCVAVVDAQPEVQAPEVPEALMVSAGEEVVASMFAEGVQIYQCKPAKDDATKFVWTFTAPEAVLYDGEHMELGTHYAGPTWESKDGSMVVAEVKARADAPTADTIPWLLLNAKTTEGAGIFGDVTSIHRVDTTGGQAPQAGCDASQQDAEARVDYTATYYFYAMR